MALPIYQPYGTVQNSFNQIMGRDPIGYSAPIGSLRPPTDVTRTSTLYDLSDDEQINQTANIMANRVTAQQRAGQVAARNTWNQRLKLLGDLRVSPDTARNMYEGAYNSGYVKDRGPVGYAGQPNYGTPGSTQYKTYQQNRELNAANNQANLLLAGIDPGEVSKAYQKFLKNNQF